MEPEKENFWFYIITHMILGDGPTTIHQGLESLYGTSLWSCDIVCWGIRSFQSVKKDLRDEPRSGAPTAAMNENAMELVRHAIALISQCRK